MTTRHLTDARAAYLATATEKDIQHGITDWLLLHGYVVLTTGQGRKAVYCPKCNTRYHPKGYVGNSTACPDIYTRHPAWSPCLWVGIEVKKPGGAVRPGQQALADAGHTFIARSLDDVIAWLQAHWWLLPPAGGREGCV